MSLGELGRAQKLLLVFGLSMVVVIAGIVYAVKVNGAHIKELDAQKQAAQKTLDETQALVVKLPEYARQLGALAVDLVYLGSLGWAPEQYMPSLVRDLALLAEAEGLYLKAVKPMIGGPPPKAPAPGSVVQGTKKITVVVSGSYTDIYEFILDLQRFPVLLTLDEVRVGVGNPSGPGGLPVLDATLNTEMTVLPQVEVASLGTQQEEAAPVAGGVGAGVGSSGGVLPAAGPRPQEAPGAVSDSGTASGGG